MFTKEYRQWLERVDALLDFACGLTRADFADWDYGTAFHHGLAPAEVAWDVLDDNGFPVDALETLADAWGLR